MNVLKLLIIVLALVVGGCSQPLTPTPRPTRAPVSPDLAVEFALEALHEDGPVGYLIGTPTILRGQVLSLADAYVQVNGKPLAEDSSLWRYRDRQVWLVISRGDWLLHIPGAHGDPFHRTPMIMPQDITAPALWNALLFDAVTGQVYDRGGIVASQLDTLESLPSLPLFK